MTACVAGVAACGSAGSDAPDAGFLGDPDSGGAIDTSIDSGPPSAQVLQYNAGNGAQRAGQLDVIEWLAVGHRPVVITLNELCGKRFYEIEEVAEPLGYVGSFFATNPDGCGGSNAGLGYGNAMFVRGAPAQEPTLFPYDSQEAGAETRNIGCIRFAPSGGPLVTACVTHLENNTTYASEQAAEALTIASQIRRDTGDGYVVVAGDFNLTPDQAAISAWLDSPFRAIGLGLITHENGKSIDYVFATDTSDDAAARTEAGRSDHLALWALIWDQ